MLIATLLWSTVAAHAANPLAPLGAVAPLAPLGAVTALAPLGAATPAPAPASSVLDVMTLNTWGLPYPVAAVSRKSRFPSINHYLATAGVEIAGLQEVWHGALGLLHLDGVTVSRAEGDSGLALVSSWPVDDVQAHTYGEARGFDRFKSKGVLQARVDVPGTGPVWVFVTHLQCGTGDVNASIRAQQARELMSVVSSAEGPAIVLGDFNWARNNALDESTWMMMQAGGLADAATSLGNDQSTYLPWQQRYDRVYLRSGDGVDLSPALAWVVPYTVDSESGDPPVLSDHQPLRVRISVNHPTQ